MKGQAGKPTPTERARATLALATDIEQLEFYSARTHGSARGARRTRAGESSGIPSKKFGGRR